MTGEPCIRKHAPQRAAHDFVFAWRTTVDPETASQYAFIMYVIKNAEAINNGTLPPDVLGARAIDARTLEVEFENPAPHFDKLVVFQTFLPIREDFYRSRDGRYAADVEDLLFNGPFVMTRWVHGSNIRLEKNQDYWNRDAIQLNRIDIPYMMPDNTARLNLYRDGQVADVDHLSAEALDQVLQERWPLGRFSDGSVWYLTMNQRPERLTANYHLRKALQLANDNGELLYKVLKIPSYTPTDSLFPAWLRGAQGLFRQEHPAPVVTPDVGWSRGRRSAGAAAGGIRSVTAPGREPPARPASRSPSRPAATRRAGPAAGARRNSPCCCRCRRTP